MGMFDYIAGDVICPDCKRKTNIYDQTKLSTCTLHEYTVGEYMPDMSDGVYDGFAGGCEHCDKSIEFKVKIKNHKVQSLMLDDSEFPRNESKIYHISFYNRFAYEDQTMFIKANSVWGMFMWFFDKYPKINYRHNRSDIKILGIYDEDTMLVDLVKN